MASTARGAFLTGLAAFRETLDEPRVLGADAVGAFLRRGLTVASFNLLEAFISDRLDELAAHINGGITQFLDLPIKLQRRAIVNTITIGRNQINWGAKDLPELRSYSETIGKSLSAVGATLELSPLTWKWAGSNMAANDFRDALRFLHVNDPWENVRLLAGRLSFLVLDSLGQPIDQSADLSSLASERHACAHDASKSVTAIWLRAAPERILRYAITFDALASVSANYFRIGDPNILSDERRISHGSVSIRFVVERSRNFAELLEGRTRATKVSSDVGALFVDAQSRCTPNQLLIQQSKTNAILNWIIPAVS